MNPKKLLVITCSIMKDELLLLKTEGISFVFLEQSLHRTPEKMKQVIQDEIKKAEQWDGDTVLLGYGLCSNGVLGIKANRHSIVIPRVHDCITLFLGSPEKYLEQHQKEPGTYYLTKGWIEEGKSPLKVYEEYCQRYPKETAEWMMKEELKNYTRIALVISELGVSEPHWLHAQENARFFNLRYEEIEGSLEFFRRMLRGPWDKDFIVLPPGGEATQEMFLENQGP
jgi:hypothetical protein